MPSVCVCVRVGVCVRACVRVCLCVCTVQTADPVHPGRQRPWVARPPLLPPPLPLHPRSVGVRQAGLPPLRMSRPAHARLPRFRRLQKGESDAFRTSRRRLWDPVVHVYRHGAAGGIYL